MTDKSLVHPTAEVASNATIGQGTRVWHWAHIREDSTIGDDCIIGKGVYVDFGVQIGNRCKIQNNASIFHGSTLEDGVFIGPHACLTNDRLPRAITPQGALKDNDDWEVGPIVIRYGSAIGASAVVLPGVTIGQFALVGAGAVVTRNVPDHGLVVGNPARLSGFVCSCGGRLTFDFAQHAATGTDRGLVWTIDPELGSTHGHCDRCDMTTVLPFDVSARPTEQPA